MSRKMTAFVFTTYTDVVNVNIEGTCICKEKHSVVVVEEISIILLALPT